MNLLSKPFLLLVSAALALSQSACSLFYTDDRPEVQYQRAYSAKQLEVPPDLSAPDQSGGFIVSGVEGGKIQRNTLLPSLDEVRFMRDGDLGWLELSASSEELWPLVREFIVREGLLLKKDEPLSGYMETTWAEETVAVQKGGLLGVIDSALEVVRPTSELISYGFRFERAAADKTRLFVSHRRLEEARVGVDNKDDEGEFTWAEAERDPEQEARVLVRLMVYLGIDVQRAKGILDDKDIASLSSPAYIVKDDNQQTSLFIAKTMAIAWPEVGVALENLSFQLEEDDIDTGRYEVIYGGAFLKSQEEAETEGGIFSGIANFFDTSDNTRVYQVYLGDTPGGTSLTVGDDNGDDLQPAEELAILNALRQQFI